MLVVINSLGGRHTCMWMHALMHTDFPDKNFKKPAINQHTPGRIPVVGIVSRHDLNQVIDNSCTQVIRWSTSVIDVGIAYFH